MWRALKFSIIALLVISIAATIIFSQHIERIQAGEIDGTSQLNNYYSMSLTSADGDLPTLPAILIHWMNQSPAHRYVVAGVVPEDCKITTEGRSFRVAAEQVTGRYFGALGVRMKYGRSISRADLSSHLRTIVLNSRFASSIFGKASTSLNKFIHVDCVGHSQKYQIVGLTFNQFHGVTSHSYHLVNAWLRLPGEARHAFAIVSAVKALPVNDVIKDISSALRLIALRPDAGFPPHVRPLLAHPFNISYAKTRLRLMTLYRSLSVFVVLLCGMSLIAIGQLRAYRDAARFAIERALGATRQTLIWQFFKNVLIHSAIITLIALTLTSCAALFHRDRPADLTHISSFVQSFEIDFAIIIAVSLTTSIIAELPELFSRIHAQKEQCQASNYSIAHIKRVGSASVILFMMLGASIMAYLSLWSMDQVLNYNFFDIGAFQNASTVIILASKPGLQSNGMPSGLTILATLQHSAQSIVRAPLGYGPVPGSSFSQLHRVYGAVIYTAGVHKIAATPLFASGSWFSAAGVRLLAGRTFRKNYPSADHFNVVIDATMARALFGQVHAAVGRLFYNGHGYPVRVIGVVAPLFLLGPSSQATPVMFYNLAIEPKVLYLKPITFALGTQLRISQEQWLRQTIDSRLADLHSGLHVSSITTSFRLISTLNRTSRHRAMAIISVGFLNWIAAMIGISAYLFLFVVLQRREFAIHSALGRGPRRLYWEVMGRTAGVALAGVVLSLLAAPWLAQQFALLSGAQVAPFGPATWIALAVLLLAVFLVAHFPARRAARAEPAESLHEL